MPPPEVGVVVVHAESVPLVREASARLAPTRASDVRARVPGVLQKRLYKEGSMVKEGQLLMLIDPAPYRAALAVANANLEQAQASATIPSHWSARAPRRCRPPPRRCRPRAST